MARAAPRSARRSTGRVLIVDDVITAGTAVRESIGLIRAAGATPAGVVLALDRQERGQGPHVRGAGDPDRVQHPGRHGSSRSTT